MKKLKAKLINYILRHYTDYDEIKRKNEELHQDIYALVKKENEIDGLSTRLRWEIKFGMEKVIMFGDAEKENFGFTGFLTFDVEKYT